MDWLTGLGLEELAWNFIDAEYLDPEAMIETGLQEEDWRSASLALSHSLCLTRSVSLALCITRSLCHSLAGSLAAVAVISEW